MESLESAQQPLRPAESERPALVIFRCAQDDGLPWSGYRFSTGEVQYAHRVALMGIADRHCGQLLVVGSAGGPCFSRFICLTSKEDAKGHNQEIEDDGEECAHPQEWRAVPADGDLGKNPFRPSASRSAA